MYCFYITLKNWLHCSTALTRSFSYDIVTHNSHKLCCQLCYFLRIQRHPSRSLFFVCLFLSLLSLSELDIHMRSIRPFFFSSLSCSFVVFWGFFFFLACRGNRFTTRASVSFSSSMSLRGLYFFLKEKKTNMFLQIDLPAVEQPPNTHIHTYLVCRNKTRV